MGEPRRIRTPLKRRLRFFRSRFVPLLVWLGAAMAVVAFWGARVTRLDAPGMVEAQRQAVVAPLHAGTIVSLAVDLADEVEAGGVLARLDDAAVRASLAVAEADVKRLEAEVRAAERQLEEEARLREIDAFSSSRNYAMRIERLRLDKLDRLIELESDQVELQRLAAVVERSRALHKREIIGDQDYDDARYQHEALEKRIKANQGALAVVERELREAMSRAKAPSPATGADSLAVALAPLQEALNVQLKRVAEIKLQRGALVLRSPLDGVVTEVHRGVGDTVLPGDPIFTVADPRSLHIVSFVEQGRPIEPAEGMVVEVRRCAGPVQVARARVVKVGSQVECIPRVYLGNSPIRRWGVRVLIDLPFSMLNPPRGTSLAKFVPPRPGEPIDVRFFVTRRTPSWLNAPRDSTPAS